MYQKCPLCKGKGLLKQESCPVCLGERIINKETGVPPSKYVTPYLGIPYYPSYPVYPSPYYPAYPTTYMIGATTSNALNNTLLTISDNVSSTYTTN